MYRATCRFYGPLNDLLAPENRQRDLIWQWDTPEPVREMIEGFGIPHVEVGLILVNGEPVAWEHRLQDGDRVAVYPPWVNLEPQVFVSLRPARPPSGRFVLDVHLGKLARWLRLLGFDAAYANGYDNETLAQIASTEKRILLTRDRRLLMRSAVKYGHWVRTDDPREQLREIVQWYDLVPLFKPFTRCADCNGRLAPVPKEEIIELLPPLTARIYDDNTRCTNCGKIYWPGSHLKRITSLLEEISQGYTEISRAGPQRER